MKHFLILVTLVFLNVAADASKSIRLKVSATVPPHPCEYPKRCKPVLRSAPTRVIVADGVVRYLGTPPTITMKDGVMTVNF